ncbi:MAG: hypothetical protein F6K00_33520 [Leptolyngbya sp. SIOISBB]|nr:hypothetical protein [Leptolyngbya sp. SIOISBB]
MAIALRKEGRAIATQHSTAATFPYPGASMKLFTTRLTTNTVDKTAIAHPSRTSPQQALYDALLPRHTGLHAPKHYEALTALSDDICHALLPLAHALSRGNSFNGIQAKAKLEQLAAMSPEAILNAFKAHSGDRSTAPRPSQEVQLAHQPITP